jgi:hypothetical protein
MSQFQQDIDAIASLRAQQGGTWDSINPAVAPTSRRLAELATQSAASGNYEEARKSAQMALKQHPFLFELRKAMKEWKG